MQMALRAARILSSETDSNIKQEQNVNVDINIKQQPQKEAQSQGISYQGSGYLPQQHYPAVNPVNFTTPEDPSHFQSVAPIISPLEDKVAELTIQNKFLELLLAAYQDNPIKLNSYVIVNHRLLIEMVKLLTGADRVDLVLDEEHVVNCGCCNDVDHDELLYVSKVLITVNGKTEELKYCRNDVSSQFVKFGISLKIVCK